MNKYQICTRCVMDTSDSEITFNSDGICNHCIDFDMLQKPQLFKGQEGADRLDDFVSKMKSDGKGKAYDCIIGISGGVDSSYVAHRVIELGLRPLAVHVDTGWNSELAVSNIEKLVHKLNIDLFTTVIDWDEMKDLQLAFLRSGVANCDVPQDHTFVAVLFNLAAKKGIRWVISGHNLQSESIMPESWGYISIDKKHLSSIHKKFGSRKLKMYPTYSLFEYTFLWPYIRKIKIFKMLNFENYQKDKAKQFLMDTYDWKDYGGKHHESRFTKFFQSFYLPEKFGFDKRRAHLASLIVSGQLDRSSALKQLEDSPFVESEVEADKVFVAKKLGVSLDEFEEILAGPCRTYKDYPSNEKLIQRLLSFKEKLSDWRRNLMGRKT